MPMRIGGVGELEMIRNDITIPGGRAGQKDGRSAGSGCESGMENGVD